MIHINKSIYSNKYIIKDNSSQHLLDLRFRRYYEPEERYVYNFVISKYGKSTVLCGRIIAYTDTKEIKIDVIAHNYTAYAPFYDTEFGNYEPIMKKINKTILEEFKKLGIIEYKNKKENVYGNN